MAKSKKKSGAGAILVILVILIAVGACAYVFCSNRVFGTYKAEANINTSWFNANLGSQTYTFSGFDKVVVDGTALGFKSETVTGTYKISGNKITFTFPATEEGKEDQVIEQEFYKGKDTIKIGNTEYTKQK